MNCAESRVLLHAHLDNELDAANSLELQRHLKTCSACAAEIESVRSLGTALRQGPLHYEAPESLRLQIRQMTRASGREARRGWLQSMLAARKG